MRPATSNVELSQFFEIASVLVRFDHVARFIVNADHSAM
jgi:hypothetical protein